VCLNFETMTHKVLVTFDCGDTWVSCYKGTEEECNEYADEREAYGHYWGGVLTK